MERDRLFERTASRASDHADELEVRQRTDVRPPLLLDVVHPGLLAYKLEQLQEAERLIARLCASAAGAPEAGTGEQRDPGAAARHAGAVGRIRLNAERAQRLAGRLRAWARRAWRG